MTHEEIRDKLKRMQRRAKEADEAAARGREGPGIAGARARLAIEAAMDEAHARGYEEALRDLGVMG